MTALREPIIHYTLLPHSPQHLGLPKSLFSQTWHCLSKPTTLTLFEVTTKISKATIPDLLNLTVPPDSGDLTAFQDTDGNAYVVSAHDQHAATGDLMITQLTADYLHVEKMVCEVKYAHHEAPYIIKMKGLYWLFVSGQGAGAWGGSPTFYATAANLAGPWSSFKAVKLSPASKTGFDSQNDFLFEVKGSAGSFVLWGGDRWSQRTGIGVGKNVWLPLQWERDEPLLKWYSIWNVDVAAGTWTTDPTATGNQP